MRKDALDGRLFDFRGAPGQRGRDLLYDKDTRDDVMFHEKMHAMGFGLTWNAKGLVTDYGDDLRFTGQNATEAHIDVYSTIAANDPLSAYGVPVETDGGSGTAGVHWDDARFGNKIMTGRLDWSMTISDMTVAALEDMGYDTVYGNDMLVA